MAFNSLGYDIRGSAAWITFNRPEAMNAITPDVIADLAHAVELVRQDADVRSVVITGTGRAFCAGADLKASLALKERDGRMATVTHFLIPLQQVLRDLRALPKPVIAAVNGFCMAGGLETVLVCDIILAARSAVFSDAHARFGLLPAIGGAWGLAQALGPYKAKEVMFTADQYSAETMCAAGLVNRVVADDELAVAAQALADQFAARSAEGLAKMKQMINDEIDMPWDLAARYELAVHANNTAMSGDLMEGLRAFNEKRSARF
ncbi:enoyl-CoA hydratase/isomerase family protein [Sphingomonas sp. MG17]|uniref:Enoyl-CoA hydratase/isomerase family protein n=1 Tax=Sphingomonas tagetis TaxID=2949092 RepID=A0A9X2HFV6_9SPHN|nr:enoyl-CoA hydratase/isomerase family protein [Sphingomonas tagetis]MCP3730043.1 enoyl-CoA hydratase/isomerase family protein [Sphingomonas tagetis]